MKDLEQLVGEAIWSIQAGLAGISVLSHRNPENGRENDNPGPQIDHPQCITYQLYNWGFILWMDEVLHHLETMGLQANHFPLGFLGGAGFRPSTVETQKTAGKMRTPDPRRIIPSS